MVRRQSQAKQSSVSACWLAAEPQSRTPHAAQGREQGTRSVVAASRGAPGGAMRRHASCLSRPCRPAGPAHREIWTRWCRAPTTELWAGQPASSVAVLPQTAVSLSRTRRGSTQRSEYRHNYVKFSTSFPFEKRTAKRDNFCKIDYWQNEMHKLFYCKGKIIDCVLL